jgi:hypothetical protein
MDYQNGKIYRLVSDKIGAQYIGSTTQPLYKRLHWHKSSYDTWTQGRSKYYTSSFPIIESGDYEIVLIEEFPCSNKDELRRRERYFIETMECININIPTRTKKEWGEANTERIRLRTIEYRERNKDVLKQKRKEYYEENKELILQKQAVYVKTRTPEQRKAIQDRYCETHKDEIRERSREYFRQNKESELARLRAWAEKNQDKVTKRYSCGCGGSYDFKHKTRHFKTKQHLAWSSSHQEA